MLTYFCLSFALLSIFGEYVLKKRYFLVFTQGWVCVLFHFWNLFLKFFYSYYDCWWVVAWVEFSCIYHGGNMLIVDMYPAGFLYWLASVVKPYLPLCRNLLIYWLTFQELNMLSGASCNFRSTLKCVQSWFVWSVWCQFWCHYFSKSQWQSSVHSHATA